MTTILNAPEQTVTLTGVSWETYERLIAEQGESRSPRFFYDSGTLEIMVPSYEPETLNLTIAKVFDIVAEELDIDFIAAGSTTFR